MVIVEIIAAYADYQLYLYRNVIYTGTPAGVLMRLASIEQEEEKKKAIAA
jgi:hypothetical protein